jgi:predicted nucleic acid-binding Zn ribbon protein
MFAPHSRENGGQPADCIVSGTASNTCNKALHQIETRKLGISFFFLLAYILMSVDVLLPF